MILPMPDDSYPWHGYRPPDRGTYPDIHLAYQVAEKLLTDERTRVLPITVEVQDGVVLLTGRVDGPARETVAAVVRAVPGVRDVYNGLQTVDGGPDSAFDEIVAGLQEDGMHAPAAPAPPYGRLFVLFAGVMAVLLATATFGLGGLLVAAMLATMIIKVGYRRRRRRSTSPTVRCRRRRF
jgi:hypothetical protein